MKRPKVLTSNPHNKQGGVCGDAAITTSLYLPNSGIAALSLSPDSVYLFSLGKDKKTRTYVLGRISTSGGGDTIIFKPSTLLEANTTYVFVVTDKVKDVTGAPMMPYKVQFTTGARQTCTPVDPDLTFQRKVVFNSTTSRLASLAMSPDRQWLYATGLDGWIRRWMIMPSGELGPQQRWTGLNGHSIIGLVFDPYDPTALWVSHSNYPITNSLTRPARGV